MNLPNLPLQTELFDYSELDAETATHLRGAAEKIRGHGRRAAQHIVEIGRELLGVRARLHQEGTFLTWLRAEFDWSHMTAYRFMRVAERFTNLVTAGVPFEIDVSALYVLAEAKTPEAAREAVVEAALEGCRVTHAQANAAVGAAEQAREQGKGPAEQRAAAAQAARLPTPSQARKQAAEIGRPVLASDGYLYSGKSKAQGKAEEAHTQRIFAYVNPIRALAETQQEPEDWLAELPPYMRDTVDEHLARARDRINRLMELWHHDEQPEVGPGPGRGHAKGSSRAA